MLMKALRRITTSISASFDWMISQVENHESLVNAAISEVNEAAARAAVQHKRVQADGLAMRRKLEDLRSNAELWSDRAVKVATLDQARALECLRRKKKSEREIAELEEQERQHAKLEKQLSADLQAIRERTEVLKKQRNLLRTRQSRAEALKLVQAEEPRLFGELDEILSRWETKVTEYEYVAGVYAEQSDDLEAEFLSSEEEGALKEELSQLVAQSNL